MRAGISPHSVSNGRRGNRLRLHRSVLRGNGGRSRRRLSSSCGLSNGCRRRSSRRLHLPHKNSPTHPNRQPQHQHSRHPQHQHAATGPRPGHPGRGRIVGGSGNRGHLVNRLLGRHDSDGMSMHSRIELPLQLTCGGPSRRSPVETPPHSVNKQRRNARRQGHRLGLGVRP